MLLFSESIGLHKERSNPLLAKGDELIVHCIKDFFLCLMKSINQCFLLCLFTAQQQQQNIKKSDISKLY